MNSRLGKLAKVDLRELWKNEEYDFSKWLAEEENLGLLSDEIGIEIRLPEKEAGVGKYSVDILAEEEGTGRKIVIENQLEKTNHDHLGKIITYAAGHGASIVIWIFKDITEEHRSAIDWLNENTGEDCLFFAIKVEAWRIGNSDVLGTQFLSRFYIRATRPRDSGFGLNRTERWKPIRGGRVLTLPTRTDTVFKR